VAKGGGSGKRKGARADSDRSVDHGVAWTGDSGPGRGIPSLNGAGMCFGDPIQAAGHTVVPVVSMRALGTAGLRRPGLGAPSLICGALGGLRRPGSPPVPPAASRGPGVSGYVHSRPIGYIDIGPEGVRFQTIPAIEWLLILRGALLAFATAASAWAVAPRTSSRRARLRHHARRR
jgi:hypothetical protein